MSKNHMLDVGDVVELATGYGTAVASDEITVRGRPVGYMYREEPVSDDDSGWRFLSGDETDDYLADERNSDVFDVNVIANYDEAIVPYLDEPEGTHLEREPDSDDFVEVDPDEEDDDDVDEDGWAEFDDDTIDSATELGDERDF